MVGVEYIYHARNLYGSVVNNLPKFYGDSINGVVMNKGQTRETFVFIAIDHIGAYSFTDGKTSVPGFGSLKKRRDLSETCVD